MSKKQIIGGISGIVLGIIVAFITPPQGLTPQAMHALGIIIWSVTYWICDVAPEYVVAIAMCTLWALFGCVPFKTAFASFCDTVWWPLLDTANPIPSAPTSSHQTEKRFAQTH